MYDVYALEIIGMDKGAVRIGDFVWEYDVL